MICLTHLLLFSYTSAILRPSSPFRLYELNAPTIDFLIYLAFFVGIAHATLGKQFPSRSGSVVSVATGVMLAIGLITVEQSYEFNLGLLGPYAASILFFLLGFSVFIGIKSTGIGKLGSLALAFVVTYVAVWTVIPDVANMIMLSRYSFLVNMTLLFAVLILLVKIFRLLFQGSNTVWNVKPLQKTLPVSQSSGNRYDRIIEENREKMFIKNKLEKFTQQTEKTTRQILEDMEKLKQLIKQHGGKGTGTDIIVKTLEEIAPKHQQVSNALLYLKEMLRKLSKFDYRHFNKLRSEYHTLSATVRKQIKQKLQDEWKKLGVENKLKKLEERVITYNHRFRTAVKNVIENLRNKRFGDAVSWADSAIRYEKKLDRFLLYIKKLEEKLERYTNQEIKHDMRTMQNIKKHQ